MGRHSDMMTRVRNGAKRTCTHPRRTARRARALAVQTAGMRPGCPPPAAREHARGFHTNCWHAIYNNAVS